MAKLVLLNILKKSLILQSLSYQNLKFEKIISDIKKEDNLEKNIKLKK